MCRVQFERQDILEADILCNKQPAKDSSENDQISSETRAVSPDLEGNGLIQHNHRHSRRASPFKTWKLPDWVNFTYSSVRHRGHQPQRRLPIPFGAHERTFSRLNSVSIDQPTLGYTTNSPVVETSTPQSGIQSNEAVKHLRKPRPCIIPVHDNKPVVPHLAPIPWDDQRTPDLPYDNPFYTRAIDNVLWLPRNPCGLLNLDDTVDVKASLTVEPAAGQLGTFPIGLLERKSPGETSYVSSSPVTTPSDNATSPVSVAHDLSEADGMEEIELPAAIAKRVQAGEADVEHVERPRRASGYRGNLGGAEKSTLSLASGRSRRRNFLGVPISSLRSATDGKGHQGRRRTHSIMSSLQLPPPIQRTSSDHELGFRHETQPLASTVPAHASTSQAPMEPSDHLRIRPSRSQNLSASSAIFREVLAEEETAKRLRILEEQTEATKSQINRKSWWTSWMFKKSE